MKTMMLAAAAALAIGAGTARAESEGPSDGTFYRAPPTTQQPRAASRSAPVNHSFRVRSETHDAWQLNGLNGGGG